MRLLFLILLLSVAIRVQAEEHKLATSPDGRYDVLLAECGDGDGTFAQIRDNKTKKIFDTEAHGYEKQPAINVTWRQDSQLVAFNFFEGKGTHDTLLYSTHNGAIEKIQIPDFVQNILGRQGAINANFKERISFLKFMPDYKCLLYASVSPETFDHETNVASLDPRFHPTKLTDFYVTLRLSDDYPPEFIDLEPAH